MSAKKKNSKQFKRGDRVRIKGSMAGEIVSDPVELAEPSKYYLVDTGTGLTLFKAEDLTRAKDTSAQ